MMKRILSFSLALFLLMSLPVIVSANAPIGPDDTPSTLIFDLNSCLSNAGIPGSASDYSEFTALIENNSECAELSLVGASLYRENSDVNMHSCAPGVNGTNAMCVGISESCDYESDSEKAVRFSVTITPTSDAPATLQELRFFENSPEQFSWVDGPTGPNNYPTLYGLRISVDGTTIYEAMDVPTETDWNEEIYVLAENPGFTVTTATVFDFELVPYCPVGNGATVAAWDLDDIQVTSGCVPVEGGEITLADGSTEVEICAGDGIADPLEVSLSGALGENSAWVITDTDLNILGLPMAPPFDLEGAGAGTCLIWHLSFVGELTGAEVGMNAGNLEGCFDLSNPITVTRIGVNGGELATSDGTTELTICAGDGNSDAFDIELTGAEGDNMAWVITDSEGNILGLPMAPPFDLEGAGAGTCLIWNLAFADGLEGAEVGMNAAELNGCFDLSNPITVIREGVNGGELATSDGETEISICAGDGISDAFDITLEGNEGQNMAWVITDADGNILGLPAAPPFDLEGAGAGTCLIWNLAFTDGLEGAEMGMNANDLIGCFDLSNPITVNREEASGGMLTTADGETELTICAGDGESDAFDVLLTEASGQNMAWVITDVDGNILALPAAPPFDLEGAGAGTCLIWNLSFADGLEGAEVGMNAAELNGCFDLSNPITVVREEAAGGQLTFADGGTEVDICAGDGIADPLEVLLEGNAGSNMAWVITDTDGNILGLPMAPPFDLDGAGAGTCLIWNLAFADGLSGAEVGMNANDLVGCFSLSNPLTVNRTEVAGGNLTTADGETNLIICADDGESDAFDVNLTGAIGSNMAWVITDNQGIILGLPAAPPFDLEGAGSGVCLIWSLSFEDGLEGAEVGMNANNLQGCHALSNPITVTRLEGENCDLLLCDAEGGEIALADGTTSATICADDEMDDLFSPVLSGNIGENTQWVITDVDANIIGLPTGLPVNLEGAGPGVCLIWNLSYQDGLSGLEVENNVASLSGCYDLSNAIVITRVVGEDCDGLNCNVDGGQLTLADGTNAITICADDDIADPLDVILDGNVGMNEAWLITAINGTILGIPASPPFDLEGAGPGVCLIWHLSYDDIEGLAVDSNANNFSGCFDLSQPIAVTRVTGPNCDNLGCDAQGGQIATEDGLTQIEICAGDGISDAFDVVLTNEIGTNSQWVITDASLNILGLPAGPPFDLEGAGPGVCIIWHLSYEDGLEGLAVDSSALDLVGCYDLSNSITVTRYEGANCDMIGCEAQGGSITYPDSTNTFFVCTGDGVDDFTDVLLEGNAGTNQTWVITNNSGVILDLPMAPPFNFEGAPGGVCLIWHLSYEDGIEGAEIGMNANDLAGCFSLSNSLLVIRNEVQGGEITFMDGSTSVEICVGDGMSDSLSVLLTAATGDSTQWIITTADGDIVGLPDTFPIDFEGVEAGTCLIWNISYSGDVAGLELGENASNLAGCFSLSNSIELIRLSGMDCEGMNPNEGLADIIFNVGPNPTTGLLKIDFERLPGQNAKVYIMDNTGHNLRTASSIGGVPIEMNVSEMRDGMYFIMVESSTRIEVKKFLKIR